MCWFICISLINEAKGRDPAMLYHVIHLQTHEMKTLKTADILDMDYDADGRVAIIGNNQENYFLLASKDIINVS
ncbi:hypothetical protein GC093_18375 [Paenibacillus sp. LMG 31456]|uniref:Uncharacterized protein n=1 Tax=Paenibacillus foliorum TaxID=2654974 RepID=A0A972GVC5_9BACL|nr:hypothetical protein [Paenibacillus foliorum]NOU95174.1 hypothetical protein [Paenibacillus foliorum]